MCIMQYYSIVEGVMHIGDYLLHIVNARAESQKGYGIAQTDLDQISEIAQVYQCHSDGQHARVESGGYILFLLPKSTASGNFVKF